MQTNLFHRLIHRPFVAVILAGAPWLSGCSHSFRLPGADAASVPLAGAQGRRIAVVLAGVPAQLDVDKGAHSYHILNFRDVYQRTAFTALTESVDTVRFFADAPGPGYDFVLYPRIQVEAGGSGPGFCAVTHEVVVKDARGTQLAAAAIQSQIPGPPPHSCLAATSIAFGASVKQALDRSRTAFVSAESAALAAATPPPRPVQTTTISLRGKK
jgi:hypothetical protein